MPAIKTAPVTIGTRFRSVIADANALWEVTGKAGNGVWRAEVVNEPFEGPNGQMWDSDYVGSTDVFDEAVIVGSLRQAAFFEEHAAKVQAARDAIAVGSTIHVAVDSGHRNIWARGTVVEVTQDDLDTKRIRYGQVGDKAVKVEGYVVPDPDRVVPLTLTDTGEVHNPNLSWGARETVLSSFRTDETWEAPDFRLGDKTTRDGAPLVTDPTGHPLHQWEVPIATTDEAERHAKNRLVRQVQETVNTHDRDNPQATLDAIAALLADD